MHKTHPESRKTILRKLFFVIIWCQDIGNDFDLGSFKRRVFNERVGELGFFAKKPVVARAFLLEIDTSVAIATSGWRAFLLFSRALLQEHPPLYMRENGTISPFGVFSLIL